ncbi:hypothetical protein ABK040_008476 [Willaertia magna]
MINFYLTGFSPFCGVDENPTQLMMEQLQLECKDKCMNNHDKGILDCLKSVKVVETSIVGVNDYFKEMNEMISDDDNTLHLFIHFGVSGNALLYELEEQAKNEKTFRAPDQRGEQPQNEPIDESQPITNILKTNLHVNNIIEQVNDLMLQTKQHTPLFQFVEKVFNEKTKYIHKSTKDPLCPLQDMDRLNNLQLDLDESMNEIKNNNFCKISFDPGLYICNYCYYSSLNFTKNKKNCKSLFVHVPTHDIVPIEQQLIFLKTLLNVLISTHNNK